MIWIIADIINGVSLMLLAGLILWGSRRIEELHTAASNVLSIACAGFLWLEGVHRMLHEVLEPGTLRLLNVLTMVFAFGSIAFYVRYIQWLRAKLSELKGDQSAD